jgi:hypothetical protein
MIQSLFVESAMDDIIVIHRTSDSKLMVELAAVVEMMMGVEDMVLSLLLLLL